MSKEQRKTNRKPLKLRASVSSVDAAIGVEPIPVRTLDLSTKGALIESEEPLFQDQVCTFKLVTSEARLVQVEGRVAWVKPQEQGIYHAGVAFRNLSADEEYWISLQLVRG
jgi:hypothetical protein